MSCKTSGGTTLSGRISGDFTTDTVCSGDCAIRSGAGTETADARAGMGVSSGSTVPGSSTRSVQRVIPMAFR